MLNVGREKITKMKLSESVSLETGDAENLKYENDYFDLITIGFGVRNFQDLKKRIDGKLEDFKTRRQLNYFRDIGSRK